MECARVSTRKFCDVVNARMFFWLVRVYVLLPPFDIKRAKARIKDGLNAVVQESKRSRTAKFELGQINSRGRLTKKNATESEIADERAQVRNLSRIARGKAKGTRPLIAANLIVQSRRAKAGLVGLRGDKMLDATRSFIRGAVNSVGYLKSGLVRSLKKLNGHFNQYGGFKRKVGRKAGHEQYSIHKPKQVNGVNVPINKYTRAEANTALVKIAAEYGLGPGGNVAIHKGSKSTAYPAKPNKSMTAWTSVSIGIADSQTAKVNGIYSTVMQKAMADEIAEMKRHLASKGVEISDEFSA
jgi:hypothetical protein